MVLRLLHRYQETKLEFMRVWYEAAILTRRNNGSRQNNGKPAAETGFAKQRFSRRRLVLGCRPVPGYRRNKIHGHTQHLLFIISQPICFVNGNSPKRLSLKAQAKSRRRKFRRLKIFYEEKCLSAFFCGPGLFYIPCFILRIGCCIGPHRTRRAP